MINRKNCSKSLFFLLLLGVPMLFLAVHPSLAAYLVTPSTYWQLDEADPITAAADDTTTVNGTCTTCPVTADGQVNQAFDFSTNDAVISFADNAVFDFAAGGDFSIEFWFKRVDAGTTAFASTEVMISRVDGTLNWWVGLTTDGFISSRFVDSNGGTPTQLTGTTNLADNAWHHVVVVRDGTGDTMTIYVDGAQAVRGDQSGDTSTDDSFDSAAPVELGRLNTGGLFHYLGALDNVAIYGTAVLTAAEISQNYINGLTDHDLFEEFVPAFINGVNDTVTDTAILGFEATLQGTAAAGNPLPTYASANLPTGASIASATGNVTWLPTDQQVGPNSFNVTASNSQGASSTNQTWTVTVSDLCASGVDTYWNLNESDPITTAADDTGTVDGTCTTCPVSTTGQVGTAFDFSTNNAVVSFADDAVFDFPAGGDFTIELWFKRVDAGTTAFASTEVLISRIDGTLNWWIGLTTDGYIAARFVDSNGGTPTQVTGSTNLADNAWHHAAIVRDGTGDTLTIYVDGSQAVQSDQSGDTSTDDSFDGTTPVELGRLNTGGLFHYQGALDEVSIYNTALSATIIGQHASAASDQGLCNGAPTIDSTAVLTATESVAYTYTATATDPETHAVTWSLTTAPTGMTIDATTGVVAWTPDSSASASENVVVLATDTYGATDSQSFTIAVTLTGNSAPVITSTAPATATEGTEYTYAAVATDADAGDTLTWSLTTPPTGMTVNASTGAVAWTPAAGSAGDVTFTLVVSDGTATDSESITVTVSAASSGGGGGGGGCFIDTTVSHQTNTVGIISVLAMFSALLIGLANVRDNK